MPYISMRFTGLPFLARRHTGPLPPHTANNCKPRDSVRDMEGFRRDQKQVPLPQVFYSRKA